MNLTALEISAFLSTYLVAGAVGYSIAKKFKSPVALWVWIVLVISALIAEFIGNGGRLLSIFGFTVYLNWTLQALCIGVIVGLIVREVKLCSATGIGN